MGYEQAGFKYESKHKKPEKHHTPTTPLKKPYKWVNWYLRRDLENLHKLY